MTTLSWASKSRSRLLAYLLAATGLALVCAPPAAAQVPFAISIQGQSVANGANITLAAGAVNQTVTVQVLLTYTGGEQAAITTPPTITGSKQFTVTSFSPANLLPGSSTQFSLTYTPTSSSQTSAQFSLPYAETNPTTGASLAQGAIQLALIGTAPSFIVTYALPSNQNTVQLNNGDTLTFPSTQVGGTSSIPIGILNQGSGAGTISSIKVTGSAFQDVAVPLLPGSVAANAALQFTLQYTPTAAEQDQGTLQVVFPDHTVTITLAGTGTAPMYTYQLIQNGQTTAITPNQPAAVANENVGSTGTFLVTVTNTGNGAGNILPVTLSGAGFAITNSPPIPASFAPGASATFTLAFTPPQAGAFTGYLTLGTTILVFSGQGNGSQLTYSYTNAAGNTPIAGNGLVLFSPVQVGQSANSVFTIQNNGTAPAIVINIGITQANTAFSLKNLPAQPLSIPVNGSATFTIVFTPTAVGSNQATLQIDTQSFTLSGTGTAPPALPTYQFTGPSGAQQPLQQPAVGLTLAQAYPLPLTGTLTLVQNPNGFSADPSVQFETGGAVAQFTIPANSLQAVFSNGSTSVKLQTGSVAGTILITPSFATSGISVTPTNPTTLQLTIPAAAPQLTLVLVSGNTPTGFTLQITGVVTSEALTAVNLTFTPAPKYNLAASTLSLPISSLATSWFSSGQSTASGGQFTLTVPFTLTSTDSGLASPIDAIQSVSVTVSNTLGTSNSVTAQIQQD
jgi:hypothetical protein